MTEVRDETLTALRAVFGGGGVLGERMGIEFVEASGDRVVATMPVRGNTQPFGLLHGGASCVLAETVGSVAAGLYAAPRARALGIEINATHHRGARTGRVTAVATPLHRGRTMATYQIEITGDDGQRVCTARLSCLLQPTGDGTAGEPRTAVGGNQE